MAFEETSTIRESLKRLLNKQIVGISETDDYENRKILGFSFHTSQSIEHSQNSISNVTIGNSQINEILIESIPNSQISNFSFSNGARMYSQNIGNNFVGNSQYSIDTVTVPNKSNIKSKYSKFSKFQQFSKKGLRTIKRYYDDLNRHVKITSSVNKIFHERKFKDLENFVNNQRLLKGILSNVSDLTEPMVNGKFDGLMEKFLKEDQNIAASNCQICQQIFKSSALMKIKYIEKFCSDAICEKLIQIHQPEILICKPYWTDIKKKSLPRMATTNERCVTAFKGILKTLTKLEWTLLKPIRISQTVFNIYLNENNYEMIDAINSVEDGKPIFVTFLPSMTTIKIYIFGKIDNLKPIICRSKLLKTFEILKEINPFYSEIQYNPNFEFADDSVSFQRKGQNPDYRILIEEYEGNENVANVDFMELIKIQDGKFGRVVETRTKPISDTLWIKKSCKYISRQFLDPEFLMFFKSFKDTKALLGAVSITEINGVINITDLIQTFQQDRYSVVIDSALTTKFRAFRGSNFLVKWKMIFNVLPRITNGTK